MNKLHQIVEGWKSYFKGENLDPKLIEMAERRAAICVECPNFAHSEVYSLVDRLANLFVKTTKLEKNDVSGHTCLLCSCQFPAKLVLPESYCPDNPPRWEAEQVTDDKAGSD